MPGAMKRRHQWIPVISSGGTGTIGLQRGQIGRVQRSDWWAQEVRRFVGQTEHQVDRSGDASGKRG